MMIVALSGNIGMGKSTTAKLLRHLRLPVFDADAHVRQLMKDGTMMADTIMRAFPDCVSGRKLDRNKLRRRVMEYEDDRMRLEKMIYPHLHVLEKKFLAAAARRRAPWVFLDIPLLFEKHGRARVDIAAIVDAPQPLQQRRLMARGLTEDDIKKIRQNQWPQREKVKAADIVIPTGLGRAFTMRRLRKMLGLLKGQKGRAWQCYQHAQHKQYRKLFGE